MSLILSIALFKAAQIDVVKLVAASDLIAYVIPTGNPYHSLLKTAIRTRFTKIPKVIILQPKPVQNEHRLDDQIFEGVGPPEVIFLRSANKNNTLWVPVNYAHSWILVSSNIDCSAKVQYFSDDRRPKKVMEVGHSGINFPSSLDRHRRGFITPEQLFDQIRMIAERSRK